LSGVHKSAQIEWKAVTGIESLSPLAAFIIVNRFFWPADENDVDRYLAFLCKALLQKIQQSRKPQILSGKFKGWL